MANKYLKIFEFYLKPMKQVSYKGRNIEIEDEKEKISLYIRVPDNDSLTFFGLIKNKKTTYYTIGNTHLTAIDFCNYESDEPMLMNPLKIMSWSSLENDILKNCFSVSKQDLDSALAVLKEYSGRKR